MRQSLTLILFFFFNDTATTEIYTLSLHDALPISPVNAWDFFGQLYFDTITHDAAALRYLVERVGLEHVVLGTDLQFDMALAAPVATMTEALTEAQIQAVAVTNPRRLFGLD